MGLKSTTTRRRARHHYLVLVSLCWVLMACQGSAPRSPNPDDWGLTLSRDLIVPAGRARILFQNSRPVTHVDLYNPHCELEIDTVDQAPQQLLADTFFITRRSQRLVSNELTAMPVGVLSPLDCSEDNYYESLFRLVSQRGQGVRSLLCRDWSMSCHIGRHLSLSEILQILGPDFKLE